MTFYFVTDGRAIWGSEDPMTLEEWAARLKRKLKRIRPMKISLNGYHRGKWHGEEL